MSGSVELYNKLSKTYDQLYEADKYYWENDLIVNLIQPYLDGHPVIDVGCGTGLFLDLMPIPEYIGIDPSEGMLGVLLAKHPYSCVVKTKLETYTLPMNPFVISLFGSISYVKPRGVRLADYSKYFLMFYAEGYVPKSHLVSDVRADYYDFGEYDVSGARVYRLTNYYIVTNLELDDENLQKRNGVRCGLGSNQMDI